MLHIPPKLRLKVEANFPGSAPLYVLALEGLSIVAALRELSWQLTVTLNESALDAAEYAATFVELLRPLAVTAHLLPPSATWRSHATLRLHSETRTVENEGNDVVLIEFSVDDALTCPLSSERLTGLPALALEKLTEAYEEEVAIIRELDGFAGDSATLLEKLSMHMKYGATLARAQLAYVTAHRAQMGLRCLYIENEKVRRRVDKFATWLLRLQGDEKSLASLTPADLVAKRRH